MKRVAIVGSQGVPARYGGFETMVENIIGENSSSDVEYTVFCSSKDLKTSCNTYKGARLKYIPIKANGIHSIIYDVISLIQCVRSFDVVLVLGVSGGMFFPFFRLFYHKKLIVNVDGLEWKREKWNGVIKLFLRVSEELALRFSDVIIADNQGIVDYITQRYNKKSVLIAYGADHVKRDLTEQRQVDICSSFNIVKGGYSITICRIEPENNCELILKTFSSTDKQLVFIGNWNRNQYGIRLKNEYSKYDNISIVDHIYDLDVLYSLRSNCKTYIHGHSAGGTNPSLVEAMFCVCSTIAYDVIYNRETTEHSASYFKDADELMALISGDVDIIDNSLVMHEIANRSYTWSIIAKQYEDLY